MDFCFSYINSLPTILLYSTSVALKPKTFKPVAMWKSFIWTVRPRRSQDLYSTYVQNTLIQYLCAISRMSLQPITSLPSAKLSPSGICVLQEREIDHDWWAGEVDMTHRQEPERQAIGRRHSAAITGLLWTLSALGLSLPISIVLPPFFSSFP